MIRRMVCISVVAVTLAWTRSAFAFEPISFKELPDLVGKQVYAGDNFSIASASVSAGEPLTLVEAQPHDKKGDITTYVYVQVKTWQGKEGEVKLRKLSRAPLRFNLRNPGTAKQLALAVFADAFEIPAKMNEIWERFHYGVISSTQPDEWHQMESMREAFTFQNVLLHDLVYGSGYPKDTVLREHAWIAAASDNAILDWYSRGIPDEKLKSKLANAVRALGLLDDVRLMGGKIMFASQERTERRWRNGLDGLSADKLEQLDAENLARLDKDTVTSQKAIKDAFVQAAKAKAQAQ